MVVKVLNNAPNVEPIMPLLKDIKALAQARLEQAVAFMKTVPLEVCPAYRETFEKWIELAQKQDLSLRIIKELLISAARLLSNFVDLYKSQHEVDNSQDEAFIKHLTQARILIDYQADSINAESLISYRENNLIKIVAGVKHTSYKYWNKSRRNYFDQVLDAYTTNVSDIFEMRVNKRHIRRGTESVFTLEFSPLEAHADRLSIASSTDRGCASRSEEPSEMHELDIVQEPHRDFCIQLIFDEINGEKGITGIRVYQGFEVVNIRPDGTDFLFSFPSSSADVSTWTHMAQCLSAIDRVASQVASFERPMDEVTAADLHSINEAFKRDYDSGVSSAYSHS